MLAAGRAEICLINRFGARPNLFATIILETAVGRLRVCVFAAFWLARPHLATATRQPPRCKQEQHCQGAAKMCHCRRRAVTQKVNVLNPANTNEYVVFQTVSGGQLRFLGLSIRRITRATTGHRFLLPEYYQLLIKTPSGEGVFNKQPRGKPRGIDRQDDHTRVGRL